ncbi:hypothetical protein AB6A40_011161 [Gnathostoma spinigerum]|uniref:Uncharacterized protein n=1 Tax=Gnathostoma spinigerum TaxID=75299 RepID=A0ABD6F3P1_9BILA
MENHEKRRRQQTQKAERLTNRIPSSVCQTTFVKTESRTQFPTRNGPATSTPFVSVSSAKSRSKVTKIP